MSHRHMMYSSTSGSLSSPLITVVAGRPGEARHVAVAGVAVPLLHACALIRAEVVGAPLPRVQVGVDVASAYDLGARHHGVCVEVGALAAEVQRRQATLEPVPADHRLRQLAVLRLLHSACNRKTHGS